MTETGRHERCVNAWLAARFVHDDHPEDQPTALLLVGLRALWERARPSLGEVTLAAIFQRAIHTAERRHHELEQLGLRVTDRGTIEVTSNSAPRVDLRDAVASVLVEVLRAVSHATADGLTAPLHAALTSATGEEHRALVLLRPPSARPDGRDERGTP
jgi:hypothetical protein